MTNKYKGTGLTTKERNFAKKRFEEYKNTYHIEKSSDLSLLEELVFLEALGERYKMKVEELSKNQKVKELGIIPIHIVEAMDNNRAQVLIISEKLGLFSEKQGDDPFQHIQRLKKKFKKWLEENQGSRTLICPHCSKMLMLKIRMVAWEALKHPFFKDKILANKQLWLLYKTGKITKKDVSLVLGTSEDYVDWLEEKIYKKDSK